MNRPKFEVYRARDGFRWRLVAGNGQIVAVGEAHTRRSDAVRAIKTVRSLIVVASVPGKPHKVESIDLRHMFPKEVTH